MKKKKRSYKLLIVFLVVVLAVVNIKNIGRMIFPIKYDDVIIKYSTEYKLDPYLVVAIIKTESNFEPMARSNKEAIGLMQITPSTASWIAEKKGINNITEEELFNEETNISFGCWYLNNLYLEFKDWDLVIAAYNGGRGNVNKWLSNEEYSNDGKSLKYIPFEETDKYLEKVKHYQKVYRYFYEEKSIF
ncbi:lytic transglycosylase domain-containing protein [Clostridium cellulovorans]|uniref:Lytic transglycosylase catalytic n=1 Tax=Clostridium cellulovorans (strain ATCC 35296 / DSM 3052 / OCM 3 / 743B) TaxID=573061 RepID=D9SRJ6_CLOC7|nr:lytic transglycosylase domain-containing protein [Clostridium cellulovorans]ADL52425.1 Lytic transglycosylase catalytic [Clostridium cellulovorans 743B]